MQAKLEAMARRHAELELLLSTPAVLADPPTFRDYAREYAELQPVVDRFRTRTRLLLEADEARALAAEADPEMVHLARQELKALEDRLAEIDQELQVLLLPQDPNDDKNVILEVRAGTGGDEAGLFAQEIVRMYTRYALTRGWQVELLSESQASAGGVKEAVLEINGKGAYSRLKHESGVHRVQRVPETEAAGRIHTSAVTVAVLPEADEVEVTIEEKDLRIDSFCSSGPGGQSVNTTYSAVRITHLPTGIVVSQQDEKSWHKNKAKAMRVLRTRLLDRRMQEQQDAIAKERRSMVKTGDRSEKIRTYNFPQNRVSDHRINFTTHRLPEVLDGRLDDLIDPLLAHYREESLHAEEKP
jgi:peptide chain release factor 1